MPVALYFVPAFLGRGGDRIGRAPRLSPTPGLTRGTTACISLGRPSNRWPINCAICSKLCRKTPASELKELKVDGGASVNNALMQFQADVLGAVKRCAGPWYRKLIALLAAYLAGLAVGFCADTAHVARNWAREREFELA